MDGLPRLVDEIARWVLQRSERNVVSLTPRRVRKMGRQMGKNLKPLTVRAVLDGVLERVEGERRVIVCRRSTTGTRVVYVLPPGVSSPYLQLE